MSLTVESLGSAPIRGAPPSPCVGRPASGERLSCDGEKQGSTVGHIQGRDGRWCCWEKLRLGLLDTICGRR
jgi:hypothetical protein